MNNSLAYILESLTTDSNALKKNIKAEAIKRGTTSKEFEASWKKAKVQLKAEQPTEATSSEEEERFATRIKSPIIELETKARGMACMYDHVTKKGTTSMVFIHFKGEVLDLTIPEFKERFTWL
jgi:hypothetical protein